MFHIWNNFLLLCFLCLSPFAQMLYGQEFKCSQLPLLETRHEEQAQAWETIEDFLLQQSDHHILIACAEALADSLLEAQQYDQLEHFLSKLIEISSLRHCPESADLWGLFYRMSRYCFYYKEDIDLAYQYINLTLTEILRADSPSQAHLLKTYYLASSIVRDYGEGDYALMLLKHAADLAGELYGPDSFQYASIQNGMGNLYYSLGKYDLAIPPYHLAKQLLSGAATQPLAYIKCIQNLATCLTNIGQVKEAKLLYEEAILHLNQYPEDEVSNILQEIYGNLGILHKQIQQYERSRTYLMRSLDMANHSDQVSQAVVAKLELEMSQLELLLGNHFPALVWAHQASSRLDSTLDIHRVQAFADVDHISYQDLPLLLHVCQLKGSALLKLYQENPQRLDELKKSLGFFEQMGPIYHRIRQELPRQADQLLLPLTLDNQRSYISMALNCAYMLYAATGQEDYLTSAFQLIEHSRGMISFEQMLARKQVHLGTLPPEVFAYGDSLRQAIQAYPQLNRDASMASHTKAHTLVRLHQQYRHWQDTLRVDSSRRDLLLGYDIAKIDDLQKSLHTSDAIWISYQFSGNSGGYIFVIDKDQMHLIPFDVSSDFMTLLEEWKIQLSSPNISKEAWDQLIYSGSALYRQLLLPVRSRIQTAKRPLIIVPDGPLHGISFAPMFCEAVDEMPGNFKALPYLARRHAISYAQSATAFLTQQTLYAPKPSYSCLGMAYSSPSSTPSETRRYSANKNGVPLLGTAQEIRNLESLISGNYFWGPNATESTFRLHCSQANLLHLAIHGIGDTTEPYLIFQQGAEQQSPSKDGYLYMKELSTLSLQAHMAVLSACETGQGEAHQREGMLSMARAFLAAGSASVMMNYWRAHDQASVSLMQAYYEALIQKQSKSQALQTAQLMYLEDHNNLQSHPAYWAGLVIWGNPDALWTSPSFPWSMGLPVLISMVAFFIGYMRAKKRF